MNSRQGNAENASRTIRDKGRKCGFVGQDLAKHNLIVGPCESHSIVNFSQIVKFERSTLYHMVFYLLINFYFKY